MAIRQGLENKCYVVGQGLLPTPVAWATVTHVCEGAQISHSNTDVMEHVAWPQDFLQIVRKALGKYPRRRSKIPETFYMPFQVTNIIWIIQTGSYEANKPKICNRKWVLKKHYYHICVLQCGYAPFIVSDIWSRSSFWVTALDITKPAHCLAHTNQATSQPACNNKQIT